MSSFENVEVFEDTKKLCAVGEKPETHPGRRGAVSCG